MKGEEIIKEYGECWYCLCTSTHWRFSDTSVSHAGSSLMTWCLWWVTLISPALPIHGGGSSNLLIMDNSPISWWLGQCTIHSCEKNNDDTKVILISALSSGVRRAVSLLDGKFGYFKVYYVPRVLRLRSTDEVCYHFHYLYFPPIPLQSGGGLLQVPSCKHLLSLAPCMTYLYNKRSHSSELHCYTVSNILSILLIWIRVDFILIN